MAIFRRYIEVLWPKVPTVLRRMATNIVNLAHRAAFEAQDAIAEALQEYVDLWPIDTAPTWLLDDHWGPYHNIQRNGLSDADFRVFIHAKRLLNKSWGTADQALEIFGVLLPLADLSFTYFPPKSWIVTITGVSMDDAAMAIAFMTKKPSPQGGGFSVAGDNGMAMIVDPKALNYGSVYGVVGVDYLVTGWYGSVYGPAPPAPIPGGGEQAGHAHVAAI